MGGTGQAPDAERFGSYLREVRESRKLSLDAVEEMAVGYADRITKSHLSRIENGHAEPTFRRMYALSQIYGVPVTMFAERFEMELKREAVVGEIEFDLDAVEWKDVEQLVLHGRHADAVVVLDALIDRVRAAIPDGDDSVEVLAYRLDRVNCILKLGNYELAKEEVERILNAPALSIRLRLRALTFFASACQKLSRPMIGAMALEQAHGLCESVDDAGREVADIHSVHASILMVMGQCGEAQEKYALAIAAYEAISNTFEWCRAVRNLAFAYIETNELKRARPLLDLAIKTATEQGYDRYLAVSLGDLAVIDWRGKAFASAESLFLRSNKVARPREYRALVFRNCFYLWKLALHRNDDRGASINERTLRTLLNYAEDTMPEKAEFRAHLIEAAS